MKKEDLLSDEFLKQFKTGEVFYGFYINRKNNDIYYVNY